MDTLSKAATDQLCVRARAGSAAARDKLIRSHMPLIVHVAKYFYRAGCFCEWGDLVQQGCLGLLHAITKFDTKRQSKGKTVQFATYAHYWITHYIRREIENNGRTIAVPIHRLREAKKQGTSVPVVYRLDQTNEWMEDGEGKALARIVDPQDTADNWCQVWETRREVEQVLQGLSPEKQQALRCHYGLSELGESRSQRTVGSTLGVSMARMGSLVRSALSDIRKRTGQPGVMSDASFLQTNAL